MTHDQFKQMNPDFVLVRLSTKEHYKYIGKIKGSIIVQNIGTKELLIDTKDGFINGFDIWENK